MIKRGLLFFNCIAAGLLLLSCFSPFVNPAHNPVFALASLAYPLLVLLNLSVAVTWLLKKDRLCLISFLVLAASLIVLKDNFAFHSRSAGSSEKNSIKVSSYNVRLFDYQNWDSGLPDNRKKIIEWINKDAADVLCLQEFNTIRYPGYLFNTLDTILSLLHPRDYQFGCALETRLNQRFGLLTLSRFPIVDQRQIEIDREGTNYCMYADIKVGNDTLRIYNMHLQSVNFSPWPKRDKLGAFELLSRLTLSLSKRAAQSEAIAENIKNCGYKTIVCGDFNDTPNSFTYKKIKGKLEDSFLECGSGMGSTYAGNIPFQRIDYILHSNSMKVVSFETGSQAFSDHYPVSCRIETAR